VVNCNTIVRLQCQLVTAVASLGAFEAAVAVGATAAIVLPARDI